MRFEVCKWLQDIEEKHVPSGERSMVGFADYGVSCVDSKVFCDGYTAFAHVAANLVDCYCNCANKWDFLQFEKGKNVVISTLQVVMGESSVLLSCCFFWV